MKGSSILPCQLFDPHSGEEHGTYVHTDMIRD